MISEIRSQTQLRFIKKIIFGTSCYRQKNSAFIQSSYECKHVPKQTNSKISTPSSPPHQANPPLFHSDQSISTAGQLYVEARRRVFGIWDGIVTSSVCPQAEYPINEWSSLTLVNSPHPLPQSALNQQSSSSSCSSSKRTERLWLCWKSRKPTSPSFAACRVCSKARSRDWSGAGLHFLRTFLPSAVYYSTVFLNCTSQLYFSVGLHFLRTFLQNAVASHRD